MEILALAENPSSGVVVSQVTGITTVIIELTGRFMHWMQMEAITLIQGSRRTDCWTATNSTGWTSYYNNDTSTPPLPYYLFIDMKETTDVNGVFLAGNNSDFAAT